MTATPCPEILRLMGLDAYFSALVDSRLLPLHEKLDAIQQHQTTVLTMATDLEIPVTMRQAAMIMYGTQLSSASHPRGYREIAKLREWGVIPSDYSKRVKVSDCRKALPRWKEYQKKYSSPRLQLRKVH